MRRNRSYRRGDIFLTDLGIPHGSEQGGRRPVIILQNDDGCLFSPTVTMVPLTTNLKKTYLKTHYITLEQLQELMLEDIRRHACLAAKDKEKYIDYLISLYQKKMDEGAFVKQKELDAVSNRLKELDQIIKRLYEDSALGRISFERYTEMSKGYIDEQKQLKSDLAVLEEALYGKKQMLSSMRQFADLVERYTDIREVSSELLHTLIDRIVIHEKEMEGDEIIMRVDVYYRY